MGFLLLSIVVSAVVFCVVFLVATYIIQCHSELSRFRNYSERSYSENMENIEMVIEE